MGVVPARVRRRRAGRRRLAARRHRAARADAVLAAAAIAGADEVYAVGGAQAIAALAYGTESIAGGRRDRRAGQPVGPGGEAAVLAAVGIDGYAGPSRARRDRAEDAPAEWIALDLCAQAEHGDDGLLVAISADAAWLERLAEAIEAVPARREDPGNATFELVLVGGADAAVELAEALAPEHLELIAPDGAELARRADDAGCVFVGAGSATAFGDYAVGSNHVLPTGGAGRFTGPLGPGTFRRRTCRRRDRLDGGCESPAPGPSTRSPAPRASRSTASRRRCGPTAGTRPARRNSAAMTASGNRQATVERRTGETEISVSLDLDGGEVSAGDRDRLPRPHARPARPPRPARARRPRRWRPRDRVATTPSRTSASPSARRSTGRSATAPGSPATRTSSCRWTRRSPSCSIDISGRPVLPLPLRAPAGDDRRLRGRADRGVLPCGREQREAHPAPVEPLRRRMPTT